MNIVFLDAATVDLGDLDMSGFARLGNYRAYANSRQDQVVARARGADVVITNKCLLRERELARLPKLKLICVAATGINNVDLEYAKQRGVAVTNVRGYSTTTVAEHTLLFLLAFSHRLLAHHRAAIDGTWSRSPHFTVLDFPFTDLHGKILGIIGYGAIGREVGRLARAFGMKVLVGKISGRKYRGGPNRISLKTLLRRSDFVSLHCPLTDRTHHLLNSKNLPCMKSSAVLLNMARGAIVDEAALARALRSGRLAGYGADVLSQEPPPRNHSLFQKKICDKVLLTPHMAWASRESRQRLADQIVKNIKNFPFRDAWGRMKA